MLAGCDAVAFVATTDYDRARAFYEGVLGLPVRSQDQFALVLQAKGVKLRVVKLASVTPSPHTVFGFEVADVRAMVLALKAKGVVFEIYEMFGEAQDADGVWTPPGGSGAVAWFKDPDGNLLSISCSAG
ncbi:VOC family protein [Phenylobacterium kunshanense]|uniref:VOC family protein n=2 Tax=Phenylobacterium kunshanense TaxID=1445034 RepID=A0A328BA81_9CAUL|nr:VOC family protein [Phenylobacterium kunshanense]